MKSGAESCDISYTVYLANTENHYCVRYPTKQMPRSITFRLNSGSQNAAHDETFFLISQVSPRANPNF